MELTLRQAIEIGHLAATIAADTVTEATAEGGPRFEVSESEVRVKGAEGPESLERWTFGSAGKLEGPDS